MVPPVGKRLNALRTAANRVPEDILALVRVIHFVLAKGKHPFGEKFERDSRVLRGDYDLSALNHLPEAKDLVRKCLEANPKTASAREVLKHPAWWSREKRTQFLCDVSDRMELEDREPGERILLKTLERASKFGISNTDWRTKIDPAMLSKTSKSTGNTTVASLATYSESSATNPRTASYLRASNAFLVILQTRSTPTSPLDSPTYS